MYYKLFIRVCFSVISLFSVCSTTLWVGQVDKKATQQDLTNLFEEFGQIESINVSEPSDTCSDVKGLKYYFYI